MCLVSILGVVVSKASQLIFSSEISNVLSAFFIGMASNAYARSFNDVALASILSAIFFLVPGAGMSV
jgi:uncharacterized membrane protein YjjB (DUF3815 family)